MRNRNTCKKLCTAMIALGLVFSGGKLAYAHNPELINAERDITTNQTKEHLLHLCDLYHQDVIDHNSRGELAEANQSEEMCNQIAAIISLNATSQAIYAKSDRASYLGIVADQKNTIESYEAVAQCYSKIFDLEKEVKEKTLSIKQSLSNSSLSSDKRNILLSLIQKYVVEIDPMDYKNNKSDAKNRIVSWRNRTITLKFQQAEINKTNDNYKDVYEELIQYLDDSIIFFEELAKSNDDSYHLLAQSDKTLYLAEAIKNAASNAACVQDTKIRMMIDNNEPEDTLIKNYEILIQYWDRAAKLREEYYNNLPHDNLKAVETDKPKNYAKAKAAQARAELATITSTSFSDCKYVAKHWYEAYLGYLDSSSRQEADIAREKANAAAYEAIVLGEVFGKLYDNK